MTNATPSKRDYITVAEAYRSTRQHAICMYHYEHGDEVSYAIGPVVSARSPRHCETCDADARALEDAAAMDDDCQGHPAGPFDPMGETVYCDGSCVSR